MNRSQPFDAVVFAGGGNRCFWQLGFWSAVAEPLQLAPRVVTAVSAGSAMACAALLQRAELTLEQFTAVIARNRRNIYLSHLAAGQRPLPHYRIYRGALLDALSPTALAQLQRSTDLRVVLTRPPGWLGAHLGLAAGLSCYLVEKRLGDPASSRLAPRFGFRAEVVSARQCQRPEQLADLILASSCTPPFTPALSWDGRPVIDGGVIQGAPVEALDGDEARVLVLLTRRYGTPPPLRPGWVQVQPSRPVPVSKWDYTDARGIRETFELGRRDGEAFLRR